MYQQPKCPYSYFSRWSSVLGCFFPVSIFNYDDKWKQLRQNDLSKQLAVFSNDIRKWLRKEIALQEENWGSGNSAPGDSSNMDDTIITIDQFCFLKKISLKYVIEISLKISLNQVYNFSPNKYPRNKILSRTVFTLNRINSRVEHFSCKCGTNFHAFWAFFARELVRSNNSTVKYFEYAKFGGDVHLFCFRPKRTFLGKFEPKSYSSLFKMKFSN